MNCIFCKIISKEIPANVVYEDEKVIAFLDIHPVNEGHVLIIPKRHEEFFCNLNSEEAGYLFQTANKILNAIQKSEIKYEGANLILSEGEVAGQEVKHAHLHIIPRFKGDGQNLSFKHSSQKTGADLKLTAEKIVKLIK